MLTPCGGSLFVRRSTLTFQQLLVQEEEIASGTRSRFSPDISNRGKSLNASAQVAPSNIRQPPSAAGTNIIETTPWPISFVSGRNTCETALTSTRVPRWNLPERLQTSAVCAGAYASPCSPCGTRWEDHLPSPMCSSAVVPCFNFVFHGTLRVSTKTLCAPCAQSRQGGGGGAGRASQLPREKKRMRTDLKDLPGVFNEVGMLSRLHKDSYLYEGNGSMTREHYEPGDFPTSMAGAGITSF